ncbi:hypothetical protein [Spongiactinospora gelatinilytica]|uniref:hypothetical protein n=1 Tax=Spongiactinospora gelatinilytica TaxID=2666298 RepID=UPI001314AEFF|nr:hypothetical protein [Spongiactinospora gelatinilytica]
MIRALCLVLGLSAVLLPAGAGPAAAHNVVVGADLRIAQTFAGAELTLVIKGTEQVPGPLRIGVETYQAAGELPIALELRSVADGRTVTGRLTAGPGDRYTRLRVETTGPHELTLRAGGEVAVVPFRVLVDRGSMWELLIYGGLFAAGVVLVGGLLTGALSRPGRAALLVAGAAAGVTVAAMVVILEPRLPTGPPDGAAPTATDQQQAGRPYVQGRVTTLPERPAAGEEFTLRIDLLDGSTGSPVDDLTAHHEALAHVVVTSEDGRYFRHVHSLRTAPGRLEIRLRADRAGRYRAYTEFEREDSGGQLVSADFTVGGEAASPGTAEVRSGAAVTRPAVPVAGRAATIEVRPTGAVRPWLGMAGHLIVRSADGEFFGHVHEMSPAGRVSAQGLRFTYAFPTAGRYLAWAQYATSGGIVTVPFTVEVTGESAR